MPEGPEVIIIRNQLKKYYVGKTLQEIKSKSQRFNHIQQQNINLKLIDVKAKGKLLVLCFENEKYLVVHFMLTGHFYQQEHNNTRIIFTWDFNRKTQEKTQEKTEKLYYDDARNFGKIEWLNKKQLDEKLKELGPSVMTKMTQDKFQKLFPQKDPQKDSQTPIATVLHEQKYISGIGNYLRAEILYKAKINPLKPISQLTPNEWQKIYKATNKIIEEVLENGGSSNYEDLLGTKGNYKFKIYQVKPTQNPNVKKLKLSGQSIYWDSEKQTRGISPVNPTGDIPR